MRKILTQLEDLAEYLSAHYRQIADTAMREARRAYRDLGPESPQYREALEAFNETVQRWNAMLSDIGTVYTAISKGEIPPNGQYSERVEEAMRRVLRELNDENWERLQETIEDVVKRFLSTYGLSSEGD